MSNWGLVTGDWGLGDVRYQTSDVRHSYRHFEQGEKSLSFAVRRLILTLPKWETRYPQSFVLATMYILRRL